MRRILTIDGGGIRGTFPAAFLANLEEDLEKPIGRYFDLISGTSTGGIIAIGLGFGMRAAEILKFYEEQGPTIFGQSKTGLTAKLARKYRWARRLWGPKYSSVPLKNALVDVFGERLLGESLTRLVIPAWHAETQKVYIFKTAHHSRLTTDYKALAVDVAMGTAAAPTYFEQYITANDVGLVDGGLWANNPIGISVVEAIGVLGWRAEDLKVLSVGCLEDIKVVRPASGLASYAPGVAGHFMAGQSEGSLGIAHILTGDPHERRSIYRISQPVPDGFYKLDDTKQISSMKSRAFAEARDQKPKLEPVFFGKPAEEFLPEHR